jgi:hypothetical protein
LPTIPSDWEIEVAPVGQLDALVEIFASGETLTVGEHFKPLRPHAHGVWELKTTDLRIFGGFPIKDHFIAIIADTAERIKTHDLYAEYIGEVVRFRDALDLNAPKFIPGNNPHDIVSNYN